VDPWNSWVYPRSSARAHTHTLTHLLGPALVRRRHARPWSTLLLLLLLLLLLHVVLLLTGLCGRHLRLSHTGARAARCRHL
jgi:hypothetical protein